MPNIIGFSVYLSSFEAQKEFLNQNRGKNNLIFTSLHINEEQTSDFPEKARQMCLWLHNSGYRVLADISRETLKTFNSPSITALVSKLHLWGVRLDFGFSEKETMEACRKTSVVLNASTLSVNFAQRLSKISKNIYAMHNFYPRPDTGLDPQFLLQSTYALHSMGIKVMAFIAGDQNKRGPIYSGLPTLESHRSISPYAAFVDLIVRFRIDMVFVGDNSVSPKEQSRINYYAQTNIIPIPCVLFAEYQTLYRHVFSCRKDSPSRLIRFSPSSRKENISPKNCVARPYGSITSDNLLYARYCGELQIMRADFPADNRINVIGKVDPSAFAVLPCVTANQQFCLIPV